MAKYAECITLISMILHNLIIYSLLVIVWIWKLQVYITQNTNYMKSSTFTYWSLSFSELVVEALAAAIAGTGSTGTHSIFLDTTAVCWFSWRKSNVLGNLLDIYTCVWHHKPNGVPVALLYWYDHLDFEQCCNYDVILVKFLVSSITGDKICFIVFAQFQ